MSKGADVTTPAAVEGVVQVSTSFDEINQFISTTLKPAIDGTPFGLVNATFLAILVQQQAPVDLTEEELIEGVKGASGWITTYVSTLRVPASKIN